MTRDSWLVIVKKARKDNKQLNLLLDYLVEAGEAKQLLRDNGYGCTGMNLLETVKEVIRYKD